MRILPKALDDAIAALSTLPGVGPRSAERYAYHLLKSDQLIAHNIAVTLEQLHERVSYCRKTFALVEAGQELSELYTDKDRNRQQVMVVAEPFDIIAIEKTGTYKGTYHVLGGLVSPIDGITPEQLHIKELVMRVVDDKVKELILATNASAEGETTALYIQQQLNNTPITITRLARGLPVGVDIEYADQITLSRALEGRTTING